jgi:uncharacterized protein YacL
MVIGIGEILEAFFLIAIMSYPLIGLNPVFRFAEAFTVGLATAHAMVMSVELILSRSIDPILGGEIAIIVPTLIALTYYTVLHKKTKWISRYAFGTAIAVNFGIQFGPILSTWLSNITATAVISDLDGVLLLIFVVSVMFYFIFHREPKNQATYQAFSTIRKFGTMIMLAGFGCLIALSWMHEIEGVYRITSFLVEFFKSLAGAP